MTIDAVSEMTNNALYVIIKVSLPVLLVLLIVSLVIGLIISIFQTVTSIQEQTLTFVPKILGIFVTMLICGSWMLNNMTSLIDRLWSNFSYYLSLG